MDIRVHDPVMIEADGRYYLFATGRGINVWSSTDLKSWKPEAPVFASAPGWTAEVVPGFRNHIWAPDITHRDDRYHLYYSVSRFGKNQSAIGHATNVTLDPTHPDYRWTDHGPVVRSAAGQDDWNAIDPNLVFDDAGTPWLAFGSFWSGIKLLRLAPDLHTAAQPETLHAVAARPRSAGVNGAVEAPFIFRKNGWYYLFVSWDVCCRGAASTYKVMVGRSRGITGPYLDHEEKDMRAGGGTLVIMGDSTWAGVGHNAAYTFENTDYLILHGYARFDEGRSKLLIREINWDEEGWPSVTIH